MGNWNRLVGYLASVASASLFYVVWLLIAFEQNDPPDGFMSVLFRIGFAIFFLLFGGMGAAFVSMALPWCLVVRWYDRLQHFGLIYFCLIGAATTLVMGCGAASLSPKPLFVEDQTFLEGFTIAMERQGFCLLLTGFVFGLTFWLVSERLRYSRSMKASS
jgi:hypothetical protein